MYISRSIILIPLLAVALASCQSTGVPDVVVHTPAVTKHFAEIFRTSGSSDFSDSLAPVFPNPFNRVVGDTVVHLFFTLKDTASVILLIQNPLGDSVAVFKDELLGGGSFSGEWKPENAAGQRLREGLYFVTLRVSDAPHYRDYINSELLSIEAN